MRQTYCYYERIVNRSRAVTEKPHYAVVKFNTYRNLQRHRAVLPAIARLLFCFVLCPSLCTSKYVNVLIDHTEPVEVIYSELKAYRPGEFDGKPGDEL